MSASRESRVLTGGTPSTRATRALPGPSDQAADSGCTRAHRKIRSIIVDDQPISREAMRRLLKQEPDVEIVGVAADGEYALDLVRKTDPDVMFLDVQMPGMDGLELASKVEGKGAPAIVFVTSNEEYAVRAFELGATDYLLKPCTRDRLKLTLQRVRNHLH